jgi:hypothetical protein
MSEMKKRPGQGAPSASTNSPSHHSRASTCGIFDKLIGVKFRLSARVCKCGAHVCIVGAELKVRCDACGVRRGHLTSRTAGAKSLRSLGRLSSRSSFGGKQRDEDIRSIHREVEGQASADRAAGDRPGPIACSPKPLPLRRLPPGR